MTACAICSSDNQRRELANNNAHASIRAISFKRTQIRIYTHAKVVRFRCFPARAPPYTGTVLPGALARLSPFLSFFLTFRSLRSGG